jgi:hypothetical protein
MSFINPEGDEIQVSDATKINLKPGDVLILTVKDDNLDHESLQQLSQSIKKIFPNNKVAVFGLGTEGEVKFHVASVEQPVVQSYCSNCDCGKKERAENGDQ